MASVHKKETTLIQIASFQDLRQRVAEKENLLWCLFYLYRKRQDFFRTNLRKPFCILLALPFCNAGMISPNVCVDRIDPKWQHLLLSAVETRD